MRWNLTVLFVVFCIKATLFTTFATSLLSRVVKEYNAELRSGLSKDFIVDPNWNPNLLLAKDWAPIPPDYVAPDYQYKVKLVHSTRASAHSSQDDETDDRREINLPIAPAPIDLPIKMAPIH